MLRIAVVGLGYWGPNLIRNVLSSPDAQLSAVVDQDDRRLNQVSKLYPGVQAVSTLSTVLPLVDAVIIATPPETHAGLIREALLADKHVLAEKPMTTSAADANALADLAEERNLVLAVDHTFLYTGAVEYLAGAIRSGELGSIYNLDSTRVNLGLYQRFASVYLDLATHDISIFNYVLGERPTHVAAISLRLLHDSFSDVSYITLRYSSGVHGHIHVSWLSPVKVRRMSIAGSKKMAVWDDVEPSEKVKVYDKGADFVDNPDARARSFVSYRAGDMRAPALDGREALGKVIDAFTKAIRCGEPMRCGARDGVAVVEVLCAIERSIEANGAFVAINTLSEAVR